MADDGPIPITPPGTRVTDEQWAELVRTTSPRGFVAAQKLLVAAEKAVHGKGLLSTPESRERRVLTRLDALEAALARDTGMKDDPYHAAATFLAQFARAYPNWQDEYHYLNRILIPRL